MKAIRKILQKTIAIAIITMLIHIPTDAEEIETTYIPTTGIVYIGDSRTVGLNNVIGMSNLPDTYVIAKVGKGYRWYISDGQYEVANVKSDNPHDRWVYIFNLGVNDLGNIDSYKSLIDTLEDEAIVYTVSVNPTVDSKTKVKCKSIEAFNNEIQTVADNYVDTYSYLIENGFSAPDGLHYSKSTYQTIYALIWQGIENYEG